ncbi:MAG: hypothetical protein P8Y69_05460 [Gammaproteobacteria bacterium]
MAERPFPAYRGEEPYIFVSYSHADAESVYPDLAWLHEQGINVWYDEGISQAVMKFDLAEPAYRAKLTEVLGVYARNEVPAEARSGLSQVGEAIERMCSSMAIVPLECRSSDEDLLALGEAIAEDVTDIAAASWRGQRLIGGRDAARFRDAGASGSEIAVALNVGIVLKGNIRKLGSKVRITVDLVNADGERIWSHRFDIDEEVLLDREDQIVDQIAWGSFEGLRDYLFTRVVDMPADQLGAWGIMYKAWGLSTSAVDREARRRVTDLLETAINREPFQPLFKGFLASRLSQDVMQGYSADRERDAQRALALAEEAARSGIGFATIDAGQAFGFLGDHERALSLAKRAYDMVSRVGMVKQNYALRLLYAGHAEEALRVYGEFEAMKLPGQIPPLPFISQAHAIIGDLEAALDTARESVAHGTTDPVIARSAYANALARVDRIDEAMQQIEAIRRILPGYTLRGSINAYRRSFATEESRTAVTSGLQTLLDLGYE